MHCADPLSPVFDQPVVAGADVRRVVLRHLQQSELFRTYQQAFQAATGLPLVFREAGSLRTPLEGSAQLNPFCALMTRTNRTCSACLRMQQQVEMRATLEPETLECYAGLVETAVPVRVGDQVLGYLQTGQILFRTPSRARFKRLLPLIDGGRGGAARDELAVAYFQTRVIPRRQYQSIIQLLAIFAQHLSVVSNQVLLSKTTAEPASIAKGRLFIAAHSGEALCLTDVARACSMSACHFCRVFKRATGLTFMEYLARARIEAVKLLLLDASTRVSEAAYAAGFQSLSQFNRVFRRVEGEAPTRYRERRHGLGGSVRRRAVAVVAA